MKKRILLFIAIKIVIVCVAIPQKHYTPDLKCCDITIQVLDLKVETAKKNIQTVLSENPDNYYLYYLDQFADFVQLLIAPNEERYEDLVDNFDAYREIMDDKDTVSPYYLYILSSMQLQLSLTKLKFGETFSGGRLGLKAYRNMERNIEKHPDFYGNEKLRGLFNVMLGNMPPFVRTLAALFGVRPGEENTIDLLSNYKEDVKGKIGLSTEASIFIALSLLLEKKTDKAYLYISNLDKAHYKVFLVKYFFGNLAFHTGNNEIALSVFRELDINQPELKFYPYYFIYGKILMNKLEPDANLYLETYVNETTGIDYIKQAYMYLAYYNLMNGDELKYEENLLNVKKKGSDKTERDREALLDMKRGYTPDTTLLKTSFLLKGGYYREADSLLATYPIHNNIFLPYQLNYLLLKGQILTGLGKDEPSIPLFQSVIEKGRKEHYDFATRASIGLAQLYEKEGNFTQAEVYYKLAKNLYKSDYYESLEALAKKGIERMEDQMVTNE